MKKDVGFDIKKKNAIKYLLPLVPSCVIKKNLDFAQN